MSGTARARPARAVPARRTAPAPAANGSDSPVHPRALFAGASGSVGDDPLALGAARISRGKLACALANPALESNVGAPCPWAGIERSRPAPLLQPPGSSDPGELHERFAAAVARALGDAHSVVLLYSGGLDSFALAVEAQRQCRRDGRRLTALVWDMPDQAGTRTLALARAQIEAVFDDPRPVVLDTALRGLPEPAWSARGPSTEWNAPLRLASEQYAAGLPDPVILSGQGGDEVFGAWNFATASLLAAGRLRSLRRYLGAFLRHETVTELLAEAASTGQRLAPRGAALRAYLAFAQPGLLPVDPTGIIAERAYPAVEAFHRAWRAERERVFRDGRQDWAQAMFFDQVHPFAHDAVPLDGLVPERAPFTDPELVAWASGVAWAERFDPAPADPYHWYKALQLRLIPAHLHALAPRYKARYHAVLAAELRKNPPREPLALAEHEVIRPVTYRELHARHGFLPLAVRNAEAWLRGALDRGHTLED